MSTPRLTFPARLRLTHDREFQQVFDARVRTRVHPITVYGRPNGLSHSRLGLSISRGADTAVKRNRIKRLVREAFRLTQHEMPGSYDFVVVARPHEPRELEWYATAMRQCITSIDEQWTKARSTATSEPTSRSLEADSQRES